MTGLLTENLELLGRAPNGIKKLRELILDLAVRGKLVPQDPSDEPAGELLNRIAEEKARLVAESKIKKQKPLLSIPPNELPFSLPVGWAWTRLGEITNFGTTTKSNQIPDDGWVLDLEDIEKDTSKLLQKARFFERNSLSEKNSFHKGDVLYGKLRPYLNKVLVAEDDGFCTTEILPFRCYGPFVAPYFVVALKSSYFLNYVNAKSYGMKMPRLGTEDGRQAFFPLPPLAEQHRIVTKVDELMALCSRLEARQADAESAHAQLVLALLDSLTQASDITDFTANWQRLAKHFDILFTTEPSIDALKQTVLQLAVMGKLVPQDPSDEPASELCKSVDAEKQRLVATEKIKDTPRLEPVSPEEEFFTVPPSWVWIRMGNICRPVSSGSTPSSELFQYDEGIPFLKVYNIRNQEIDFDYKKQFVSAEYHAEKMKRSTLIPGDVVMNIVGPPLGKVAIIPDTFPEWNCNQAIVFFGLIAPVSPQYIYIFLTEGSFLKKIALIGTAGQDNISITKSKNIAVPLPPLAEQHRIVAKVDQLMALCNQLKTRLTQARQLNGLLASTLVDRALANDGRQAPIATDQTARTLLAAEVTHRLHAQRTFGQRKLQKVVYLAEHAAKLDAIQGSYLRNVAGPHDRHLMNQVEAELQKYKWYERIDRKTVGHAYRPLSHAGQHRQAYIRTWSADEQAKIEQVIELMREWDTDRCEMTVTLYAAWNDFIIEGRPVTDEAIVDEVMHRWNEAKLRFSKGEWLDVLTDMKKHGLLTPTGFGKRTTGGTPTLPGVK